MSRVMLPPAQASDFEHAHAWLGAAGQPTVDLTPAHLQQFVVAMADERPVGMVGLEQLGTLGLLRSLVVDPGSRSGGLGQILVEAIEAQAAAAGVRELWLLTIDAEAYFAARGYETRDRSAAPTAIRQTPEFSSLCPGDAFLMSKRC